MEPKPQHGCVGFLRGPFSPSKQGGFPAIFPEQRNNQPQPQQQQHRSSNNNNHRNNATGFSPPKKASMASVHGFGTLQKEKPQFPHQKKCLAGKKHRPLLLLQVYFTPYSKYPLFSSCFFGKTDQCSMVNSSRGADKSYSEKSSGLGCRGHFCRSPGARLGMPSTNAVGRPRRHCAARNGGEARKEMSRAVVAPSEPCGSTQVCSCFSSSFFSPGCTSLRL